MRIITRDQKTKQWFDAKVGKIGGSGIKRAMSKLKRASGDKKAGNWSADHDNYVRELAWELVTRIPTDHHVTKAMDIGSQYEGEARIEYWQTTGNEVEEVGWVLHPTLDFFGCSPDGIMLQIGRGLEIKVPLVTTHLGYMADDVIPEEYIPQMQCCMGVCGLPEWDFMSYCPPDVSPDMPDRFRRFIKTLKFDKPLFEQMEEAAIVTMEEAVKLAQELAERYPETVRSADPNVTQRNKYATADEAMEAAASYIDSIEGGMSI